MRLWKVIEMSTPYCRANERSINNSDNETLRNQRVIEIALDQKLRTWRVFQAKKGSDSGTFVRSYRHIRKVMSTFTVMYVSGAKGLVMGNDG
jgi:hypothetical protein